MSPQILSACCYSENFGYLMTKLKPRTVIPTVISTIRLFHTHEGKFTPVSIMLSFLRISGSNYSYDMLNRF